MMNRLFSMLLTICFIALIFACGQSPSDPQSVQSTDLPKVIAVSCSGQPNAYTFSVAIESPDTGCDQYADWWEVFTPDSMLVYRRILAHSHVNEQPFMRSGGPVEIGATDFVYVRAHLNNLGYGTQVFSGNVLDGLTLDSLGVNFAIGLETTEPLPIDCDF